MTKDGAQQPCSPGVPALNVQPARRLIWNQGRGSEWDQGQGSEWDQGQGSECDQGQGSECDQGVDRVCGQRWASSALVSIWASTAAEASVPILMKPSSWLSS